MGIIPSLKDFDDYGEMDVLRIFDNSSLGSYYKFLVKYDKDYEIQMEATTINNVVNVMTNEFQSGSGKKTYEDVCRLLEWESNEVPLNIGGYKYDAITKTFPVFINYDKPHDISDTIKFEDRFVSPNTLIAISKNGRNTQSNDVQNFLKAKERGIRLELFVRKNKDDKISKEFYYLGRMYATGKTHEIVMADTNKTAVEIEWILDTPVREDIYEYIIE